MKFFLGGLIQPFKPDALEPMVISSAFEKRYDIAKSMSMVALHGEGGFTGKEVGVDDFEWVVETGFENEYEMAME